MRRRETCVMEQDQGRGRERDDQSRKKKVRAEVRFAHEFVLAKRVESSTFVVYRTWLGFALTLSSHSTIST
jgi:hypothetical protein